MLVLTRFHRLIVLSLLALGFVSACSSAGRSYTATGMNETLETEILPNASKMFVYRLRWPEGAVPSHIRIVEGRNTIQPYERSGVEVNRNTYLRLQQNATYVVAQMGYCREGYLELDSNVSRYHLWLKGECRESATAEDKERFGETQTLPVPEGV